MPQKRVPKILICPINLVRGHCTPAPPPWQSLSASSPNGRILGDEQCTTYKSGIQPRCSGAAGLIDHPLCVKNVPRGGRRGKNEQARREGKGHQRGSDAVYPCVFRLYGRAQKAQRVRKSMGRLKHSSKLPLRECQKDAAKPTTKEAAVNRERMHSKVTASVK